MFADASLSGSILLLPVQHSSLWGAIFYMAPCSSAEDAEHGQYSWPGVGVDSWQATRQQ